MSIEKPYVPSAEELKEAEGMAVEGQEKVDQKMIENIKSTLEEYTDLHKTLPTLDRHDRKIYDVSLRLKDEIKNLYNSQEREHSELFRKKDASELFHSVLKNSDTYFMLHDDDTKGEWALEATIEDLTKLIEIISEK